MNLSNNKFKILYVEDESNIRSFVQTALEANGYQVFTAATCEQGILMWRCHLPDLIILDLGLPNRDGLELLREVRSQSVVPILILSARTQESDKVCALDLGANDYITKPFGTAELMARVRVALRTSQQNRSDVPRAKFVLHDLEIDYPKRLVIAGGKEVKLTQTEYNIVAFLSEHAGRMMTYSSIIRAVWGVDDVGSTKKLQVNMANIRKKLGIKPGENRYIINELGVGYRMLEENE